MCKAIQGTKLTAWFELNKKFADAKKIKYSDVPTYFTWQKKSAEWTPRKKLMIKNSKPPKYDFERSTDVVVGRMYTVSPREGERYYLRTLLLHKCGATSYEDLRTVNEAILLTFREACCEMGLLADDAEWSKCLKECFGSHFTPLSHLFRRDISKLARNRGNKDALTMLEDDDAALMYALQETRAILSTMGYKLEHFGISGIIA
eukprot:IDg216t1